MKKFHLFAGAPQRCNGFDNYRGAFDTLELVMLKAFEYQDQDQWTEVVGIHEDGTLILIEYIEPVVPDSTTDSLLIRVPVPKIP